MTPSERFLRTFLRVIGTTSLMALPCSMIPYSWMNAIHQRLGMGELPSQPIVGYLARSTCLFYALLGGLLWTLSFDLRRYRPVLCYTGAAVMGFGLLLWEIDFSEGLPLWWSGAEGPINIAFGAIILIISRSGSRQCPDVPTGRSGRHAVGKDGDG